MRSRHNWYYLVLFLVLVSLFLVACERPLPGGYNDPYAGSDTTEPDVPVSVPEVDSEAYPADMDTTAPEGASEDAAYPVEEAPVEQGVTAGEEPAPEAGEAPPDAGAPAADTPTEVTPVPEEAPSEEATPAGEAPAEATAAEGEATAIPGTHTVAEGENLYRIGLLYGINWLDLAAANDIIDPADLTVGQVLIIPTPAAEVVEATEAPAEEPAATEAPTEPESAVTAELPTTYVVQQGDNLFRIGVNFGVPWAEIVAANGIVGNQIYPGQELIIPAPADAETAVDTPAVEVPETPEAPAAEEAVEGASYTVQEGDTVFSVAFRHSIPWTSLVEANDLQAPYSLEIGQTLIIPAAD